MKKSPLLVSLFAATVFATAALFAADPAKEVTVTGEAKCAKCALDETEECQNAIEVMENGQKVTYYLAANDVSKAFHRNVCTSTAKVVATGTVEIQDGKHVMTVTKIEKSG